MSAPVIAGGAARVASWFAALAVLIRMCEWHSRQPGADERYEREYRYAHGADRHDRATKHAVDLPGKADLSSIQQACKQSRLAGQDECRTQDEHAPAGTGNEHIRESSSQ